MHQVEDSCIINWNYIINNYWDFRAGRLLNHFLPIFTVYFTHRHIYNCGSPLQTAATEAPGGGEGRMTGWRRELSP